MVLVDCMTRMMIVQIREESYFREPQDFSGWPGQHIGRLPKPNLCNANTQKEFKGEKGCTVPSLGRVKKHREHSLWSCPYRIHTGQVNQDSQITK